MSQLADLQAGVRAAVVAGDVSAVASLLRGGSDPRKRLAIHHRHYTTSLVTALVDRFPATIWLVGSPLVTEAARAFVQVRPPTAPCIAEYGQDFPGFLARQSGAMELSYLEQFATLEWHLSRLALAVEEPAVTDLAGIDARRLADAQLVLQSSVYYLPRNCGVDHLISLYLTDSEPERYDLEVKDIWLELRGVRGKLRMNRLLPAEFAFRRALLAAATLGDAATAALEVDPAFEPGQALFALLSEGLIVSLDDSNDASRRSR